MTEHDWLALNDTGKLRPSLCCRGSTPLLAILLACTAGTFARATTPNWSPHPALLLPGAERFIAQDDTDSLALYSATDGSVLRRFPVGSWVKRETVLSPDGKHLLVVCGDGISLWDVETGERPWSRPMSEVGLWGLEDPTFSQDGRTFVGVAERSGQGSAYTVALVGSSETGQWLGTVPVGQTDLQVDSAALSPDGARGVLMGHQDYRQAGHLRTFDVGKDALTDTGLRGAGRVRYSSDGRYMIWQDSDHGRHEDGQKLRAVSLDGGANVEEVGEFTRVGRIKSTPDGRFLITGLKRRKADGRMVPVGLLYSPQTGEATAVYELESDADKMMGFNHPMEEMDFDPDTMRGVYSTFDLQTYLIDLRTGKTVLTIDNSANYRAAISWYGWFRHWENLVWLLAVVMVSLSLVLILWRKWRRRVAHRSLPGRAQDA